MCKRTGRVGTQPAPQTPEEQQALIDALQKDKTKRYKALVESSAVCRPGVLDLMDEALADPTIAVGVCSASTKEAAQRTLSVTLGQERVDKLDVCILGDDVSEKKPSPLIYNEAAKRIGIANDRCVVIEDSLIGLKAAKGAVSMQQVWLLASSWPLLTPSCQSLETANEMRHYLHGQHKKRRLLWGGCRCKGTHTGEPWSDTSIHF